MQVSIPFGDSALYDFIVDSGDRLWKIQVKSTKKLEPMKRYSRFGITAGHGRKNIKYREEDCDLIAAYVEPHDTWYLIPVRALRSKKICLYPHKKNSKGIYERYQEKWQLLNGTD